MSRPGRAAVLAVAALAASAGLAQAGKKAKDDVIAPVPVARLAYAAGLVEQQPGGRSFGPAREGAKVSTGDHIRTGPDGTARIEYPWVSFVLGPSSLMAIPPTRILATELEQGRLEQHSDAEVMKLVTPEATVRGKGRLVVRREQGRTAVTVIAGAFTVEASDASVNVTSGHGSLVAAGEEPSRSVLLPTPADARSPGEETVYVPKGGSVDLDWRPETPAHVQVLSLDREDVLLERDVANGPVSIPIPWTGTYRWRVALRGAQGLESLPSADGLLCVVDE